MKIKDILLKKKNDTLEAWFNEIIKSYPDDSHKFFKNKKNQFGNPVGYTIHKEIESIFDGLLKGGDPQEAAPYLDEIIKIRAVQEFTPAQAIHFVFLLKNAVRAVLKKDLAEKKLLEQLAPLETEIDDLALVAFNIYMSRRERLYQIRAREVKNRAERLLQRVGIIYEHAVQQSEGESDDSEV
jgi:hypothetical protein